MKTIKKEFNRPTITLVAMEAGQIIAASSQVDKQNYSNGRGARQNNSTGSFTPITSSEAFGD